VCLPKLVKSPPIEKRRLPLNSATAAITESESRSLANLVAVSFPIAGQPPIQYSTLTSTSRIANSFSEVFDRVSCKPCMNTHPLSSSLVIEKHRPTFISWCLPSQERGHRTSYSQCPRQQPADPCSIGDNEPDSRCGPPRNIRFSSGTHR
jgi:hypothetical protein